MGCLTLGIGLMMIKVLALNGANKIYIIVRRREILEEAAQQSSSGNIIPIPADVGSKEDIKALAEHIRKDLNLLVANAGTWSPGPGQPPDTTLQEVQAEEMKMTMDEWDKCFPVSVQGCYYFIMAVLDRLDQGNKRKKYCNGEVKNHVIVISSVGVHS